MVCGPQKKGYLQHQPSVTKSHQDGGTAFPSDTGDQQCANPDGQCNGQVIREGGTRVHTLNKKALFIMKWAENHLKSLKAIHVPGQENTLASRLS